MVEFNSNELIEAVLYSDTKIKSFINYIKLLRKIKKISPDYKTLETIYEFIDQLNYAYFYCLDDTNHLFIKESRKKNNKPEYKSLIYKDHSVTMSLILKSDDYITLDIERHMGYKQTSITFKNREAGQHINTKLEQQLFINCTNLIMNELYKTVKKYRKFGRIK